MTNDQEKIIEKVQKLLSLSTSSNANEAALAAERATELLLKYNLTLADVEVEKSPYTWHDMDFERSGWRAVLVYGIIQTNLCEAVLNRKAGRLHIVGKKHNIEVVLYLYTYLVREIDRLAQKGYEDYLEYEMDAWDKQVSIRTWKNAFREGAVQQIVTRLKEAQKEVPNDCRALVVVVDAELKEELRKRFKKLHAVTRYVRHDAGAYASGQAAGRNISLHQGVSGKQSRKQIG